MTKDEILRYVAKTPHNTNPNMIGNMIDALVGEGGSMPKDYPLNNKNILFDNTVELSLDSEIYVLDSLNPDELPNYSITINNKQAESITAYGMPVYGIETPEGIIGLIDGRVEGMDAVIAITNYDAGLVSIQVAEPAVDIDFLKGVKAALRTDHILTTGEEIYNQKSIPVTQDGESDHYFLNLGIVDISTLLKVRGQELTLTLVEHFEGESTSYTTKLQFNDKDWSGTLDNGQSVQLYFDRDAETESLIGFLDYEGINSEATYDIKFGTLGTALSTVEEGVHAAAENTDLFSTEGSILIKETGEHAAYNEQYNQDCFAFSDMASTVSSAGAIQLDIRISSGKKVKPTETEEITCRFIFKSINELTASIASNNHIIQAQFKADENNNLLLFLDPITYDDYDITISKLATISPAIEQGVNITLQNTPYIPPQPINENQFLISVAKSEPQFLYQISGYTPTTAASGTRRRIRFFGQQYTYNVANPSYAKLAALRNGDQIYVSIKSSGNTTIEHIFRVVSNEGNNIYATSSGDYINISYDSIEIVSLSFTSALQYGDVCILILDNDQDIRLTSKWVSSQEAANLLSSTMKVVFTYNSGSGWQCNYSMNQILTAYQNNATISAVATGGPSGPANLYGYNFDTTIEYPLSLTEVSVTDNYQYLEFYFNKPQMVISGEKYTIGIGTLRYSSNYGNEDLRFTMDYNFEMIN